MRMPDSRAGVWCLHKPCSASVIRGGARAWSLLDSHRPPAHELVCLQAPSAQQQQADHRARCHTRAFKRCQRCQRCQTVLSAAATCSSMPRAKTALPRYCIGDKAAHLLTLHLEVIRSAVWSTAHSLKCRMSPMSVLELSSGSSAKVGGQPFMQAQLCGATWRRFLRPGPEFINRSWALPTAGDRGWPAGRPGT